MGFLGLRGLSGQLLRDADGPQGKFNDLRFDELQDRRLGWMNDDTFFRLVYLVGEFHATSRVSGRSGSQRVTEQRFEPLELLTTRIELRAKRWPGNELRT